jgi:hypothetical protein
MMRAIGFCATPSEIRFAILEGSVDSPVIVDKSKLIPPKIYKDNEAARLSWYRQRIIALIDDSQVNSSGIRFPESNARGLNKANSMRRLRTEGVIMEALHSKGVPIIAQGAQSHIKGLLGVNHSLDKYASEDISFRGITLNEIPKYYHDCIFACAASLGGGGDNE